MNIHDLHERTWKLLNERRAKLPHALLLAGRRGIGKFDLARSFAESLLCEKPLPSGAACGGCPACRWMRDGNHPDFRQVLPDAISGGKSETTEAPGDEAPGGKKKLSQEIKIDQIRALDDFLHVGTHRQGLRVVLIHPAEAMNRPAANSLLKSLEEPVPGTLFLLVSSEPERLLPTIRSRCQRLPVPAPDAALAQAWLAEAGVGEAGRWLALAGGSPLLAVELAKGDERALLDALTAELAKGGRIDPLAAAAALDRAVKAELAKGGRIDPLAAAAALDRAVKAEKCPAPLKRVVEWAQKWFADLILSRAGLAPRYFRAQAAPLAALAGQAEWPRLLAMHRKALQYRQQCEQPLNGRLFLEDFFLGYAALFEPVRNAHG